jgi:hypothetical protein
MKTIRQIIEAEAAKILKANDLTIEAFRSGPPSDRIRKAYMEIREKGVLFEDGMIAKYLKVPAGRIKNIRDQTYSYAHR